MKGLVVFAVVALVHGSYATLLIKGPPEPVLDGDRIMLECQYSDSEYDISQVHFEAFNKYTQAWHLVLASRSCFYRTLVEQDEDRMVLVIRYVGQSFEGPYRCVSDAENVTEPNNVSLPLAFKVQYMRNPSLSVEGYSRYLPVPEELRVRVGDDVAVNCSASSSEEPRYYWSKDGGDWILPSSQLMLQKVSLMDGGRYTCMVEHPSVASLNKKRSIRITVLPEDAPWYKSSKGHLMLMTLAVAVCFLAFIISTSLFLHHKIKQLRTSKGPIDDRSQKKPIYKASVESIPSTCADKQPLV